jgi:hypothetical protein
MANAQVVTVQSRTPDRSKEPYYRPDCLHASLRRFAEKATVLGADSSWEGLNTKSFLYRDWLRAGNNTSDRLILVDAFDVIFLQHPHGLGDRCIEWFGEDAVVYNGEHGMWPRGDLSDHFPDTGRWRYLNSGVIFGSADNLLKLFEAMDLESIGVDRIEPDGTRIQPNDQGIHQEFYVQQPVKMVVDGSCKLAMTFSATTDEEFELRDRVLYNKVHGTTPGIGHFNGSGMNDHFHKFLDHWELP